MTGPYSTTPNPSPLRSDSNPLRDPKNRNLLIIAGVVLLALLIAAALWQTSGTHGARRDLSAANDHIMAKQKEVDDARAILDQKLSELRVARAEADAQATKLGSEVAQDVRGTTNDARITDGRAVDAGPIVVDPAQQYYVRDRNGNFVRATRP